MRRERAEKASRIWGDSGQELSQMPSVATGVSSCKVAHLDMYMLDLALSVSIG